MEPEHNLSQEETGGILADLVLYNARVITLDPKQPRAEIVAIAGNRILGVAAKRDINLFKGKETKLVDCQGGTLAPGFYDAHCHPLAFAASMLSMDCGPSSVRSIGELKAQIRQQAERLPQGTWIKGTGYNEFYLAEKRHPSRQDLDEATPYHPVKISHRSSHACVLNTLAMRLANITEETPDPPQGLIDRDWETGEPTGLLFEMNAYVEKVIPPLRRDELKKGISLANRLYISQGITSLQDASWNDVLQRWQIFQQAKEEGDLASRVSVMMGIDDLKKLAEKTLPGETNSDQLCLGAVKIPLNETSGSLHPSREELFQQILQAHQAGFQVALHAIEQSTVETAATTLEKVLNQIPKEDHRHRIEHCSVCPFSLIQRLGRIKAVIVTQPPFLYYSGERYLETVEAAQFRWLYPFGSLLQQGLKIAASSDSPVAPSNPLIGIYSAVTRKAETGQTLLPQECISPLQALEMYTINASYASFAEKSKGSITSGKLADLILLEDDPTQVPSEEIKDITVLMTIIDGKIVWERG